MTVEKLPRIPLRRDQKLVRDVGSLSLKLKNGKQQARHDEDQDLELPMRREKTFAGGLAAAPAKVNFNPNIVVKEINEMDPKRSPSLVQEDEFADEPLPPSPNSKFQRVTYSPPPSKNRAKTAYPKETQSTTDEQIAQLTEALKLSESPSKQQAVETKPSIAGSHESQHWLIYKSDPTPEYIIEAKKRLGQIKQKFVPPITQLAVKSKETTTLGIEQNSIFRSQEDLANKPVSNPNRHWLTFENPITPENVREIRRRLGDDRYKRLPSSYPRPTDYLNRSKTCLEQFNPQSSEANFKSETLAANLNSDSVLLVENNTNSIVIEKDNNLTILDNTNELDVSKTYVDEQYKIPSFNASDNLLDSNNNNSSNANAATPAAVTGTNTTQAEVGNPTYEYNITKHLESVFAPGSKSEVNKSDNFTEGQQQLNELTNLIRSNSSYSNKPNEAFTNNSGLVENSQSGPVPIPFESWLKTANESERNSVMRVLREMERSPKPLIQQSRSKSSNQYVKVKAKQNNSNFRAGPFNQPFSNSRGSSRVQTPNTRKLGTTRNAHLFPCEVCEKMLVKKHLWEFQQTPCVHQGYNF